MSGPNSSARFESNALRASVSPAAWASMVAQSSTVTLVSIVARVGMSLRKALLGCALIGLSACSQASGPAERDDSHDSEVDGTAVAATVEAMPDEGIVGPPPPPGHDGDDPFEGRVWGLVEIEDAEGRRAALGGSEVNLLFLDGNLSGSAGCNTVAGAYERSGEAISLGALGTTRMMCARPEGVMEQERAVLAALEQVSMLVLEPGGLELRDDTGSVRLHFIEAAGRPVDAP